MAIGQDHPILFQIDGFENGRTRPKAVNKTGLRISSLEKLKVARLRVSLTARA
jgi:hypothetical protein